MTLSVAQMALMSRLLDEALPLDAAARRDWLERLSPEYRELAQYLREALLPGDSQAAEIKSLSTLPKLGAADHEGPVGASGLNLNRLQDYFATVPGLTLSSIGAGQQIISLRGISTDSYSNPTVAVTLDDVPFGSSTYFGDAGVLYPDIDPSDLARIEILRGPQGTLYGADSLGGLIKFVTLDPSTTEFSGRIQVLGDDVEHGAAGYGVHGAVNLPLSDAFAIRASGFTRRDPGYIEDLTTGQTDVNDTEVYGGRVSALWRPSGGVSLKLSALLQHSDSDASGGVNASSSLQLPAGNLQVTGMPGTGRWYIDGRLYTARLTAAFGGVDFVSISGYQTTKWLLYEDFTTAFGSAAEGLYDVSGSGYSSELETQKFTQEFRFSSAGKQTLDWMAGAFYTHEDNRWNGNVYADNLANGAPVGLLLSFYQPPLLLEYALFGDLTIHFTDRFDTQLGGRESENKQTYNYTNDGPLGGAAPSIYVAPTERTTGNAFTYLVTPSFRISPDLMVYARAADGYRLGGPNIEAVLGQVPLSFRPDRTTNYELGLKADLFDHTLILDTSAYYIDWSDIQLSLFNPTTYQIYFANGGKAKSQGLELSVQARPIKELRISAVASVNDATLTQNLPATSTAFGLAGDQLPYSSHFTGNLTADQDILHTDDWRGFVGASLGYVGLRLGDFQGSPTQPRSRFPAYVPTNLHTGAEYGSWTANLFINNVGNKRAILGTGPSYAIVSSGTLAYVIQPRTVGLFVAKNFGPSH
jgi:iron complex outermembrane receptor protein